MSVKEEVCKAAVEALAPLSAFGRRVLPSVVTSLYELSSHAFNSINSDYKQVDHLDTHKRLVETISPFARSMMKASANPMSLTLTSTNI